MSLCQQPDYDWLKRLIICGWEVCLSTGEQRRSQKFCDLFGALVRQFISSPLIFSRDMEHSSLDLSIVKKEPGFGEPFSPESGLFDNMMSEDFHDTTFHSMVSKVSFIAYSVVKLFHVTTLAMPSMIFLFTS